ncbi:hypothetical protein CFP56_027487 [Quercus suber]|uniref:Uncharacterized protein n=1 Tax=Quercus suber TaxID=58331 RepID=A0AAW0JZ89_QUESU
MASKNTPKDGISMIAITGLKYFVGGPTVLPVVNSNFILASERTQRKDPLNGFKKYTKGWNIHDRHYWARELREKILLMASKNTPKDGISMIAITGLQWVLLQFLCLSSLQSGSWLLDCAYVSFVSFISVAKRSLLAIPRQFMFFLLLSS